MCHLVYGGLLLYIVPYYRLTPDICRILSDNFSDLTVWRFSDGEFQRFKQVVVMGLRKHRETDVAAGQQLERQAVSPEAIPPLSALPEHRYSVPTMPCYIATFSQGLPVIDIK